MVTIEYAGRTGNNIFQYAFGRMIAEKNGLKLGTDWPHQGFLRTTDPKPGEEGTGETVLIRDMYHDEHDQNWHQNDYRGRRVHCLGFYQHPKFYDDNEAMIRSFFNLRPVGQMPEGDIVMHLRLSDYFAPGLRSVIHPHWYGAVLAKIGYRPRRGRKLYLVVQTPKDDFMRHYMMFDPIIVSQSATEDFHFMRRFNTIICSNSSYSWWSAWLSNAKHIYTFAPWMREPHQYRMQLAYMKRAKAMQGTFVNQTRKDAAVGV